MVIEIIIVNQVFLLSISGETVSQEIEFKVWEFQSRSYKFTS